MLNKLLTLRQLCPLPLPALSRAAVCFCLPTQICNDFFSLANSSKQMPTLPPFPLPPAPTARAHNAFFIHTLQMKRAQLCDATGVRAACVCVCHSGMSWGWNLRWVVDTHTHKCKYTGVLQAEVEVVLCVRVCVCVCVSNGIF